MKRLKYLFMALVMVTCLVGSSVPASASSHSSGKAFISQFYQASNHASFYSVSNITDQPISVKITFYTNNGSILTDDNNISTGKIIADNTANVFLNYNDQNSDSSLTFTLNAHCTGIFSTANTPTTTFGYGTIEWEQDSSVLHGLVAYGVVVVTGTGGERTSIPVNNGLPF